MKCGYGKQILQAYSTWRTLQKISGKRAYLAQNKLKNEYFNVIKEAIINSQIKCNKIILYCYKFNGLSRRLK